MFRKEQKIGVPVGGPFLRYFLNMSMSLPKMVSHSFDPREALLTELRRKFPEVFTEGQIDLEKMQNFLREEFGDSKDRYRMTWAGRKEAIQQVQVKTTDTLVPDQEQSVNFDTTENIFIEGDNLEALRVLQKSYYGKVKMIYIDPPYNTGNDFVYKDDYSLEKIVEQKDAGIRNNAGHLNDDSALIRSNKNQGHYHSTWLSMIFPRLYLAKNLLRADGIILVSIDDNEVASLRLVMDEIFGEENFVGQFIWRKKAGGGQTDDHFVREHEYIIAYRRSEHFRWLDETIPTSETKFNKSDTKGKFTAVKLAKWGNAAKKEDRPSMHFSIKSPTGKNVYPIAPDGNPGRWRVGKKRMQELLDNDLIFWSESNGIDLPYEKIYFDESAIKTLKDRSILYELASTGDGTETLTSLFKSKDIFENPKPIELIHFFARNNTSGNDIILDFFAGSGSTAHGIMQLNAEDGGSRKWICVQLGERCEEDSNAYKEGYKSIAAIAQERIRRAGKKLQEESGKTLDVGFKAFRLAKSNFPVWQGTVQNEQDLLRQMDLFVHAQQHNAKPMDLLYELILKEGLCINIDIQQKEIASGRYYLINQGKLVISFASLITDKLMDALFSEKPEKIILLESAFTGNDELKMNTVLHAQTLKVDIRVI